MMHFSPSTGGFYRPDLHAAIPDDAVAVTEARHRQLLDAQAKGRVIVAGEGGRPMLAPVPAIGVERLRGRAVARTRAEARRRRLTIASAEQQLEDIALLALSQVGLETASDDMLDAALRRRIRIRVTGEAAATIEAAIDGMTLAQIAAFDPAADPRWPSWDD